MGASASTHSYSEPIESSSTHCYSKSIESTTNLAGASCSRTCSRTLENYIDQSHVSSRWQQNCRPILFCIKILRSIIVKFAQLESLGIKHGYLGPEHITIDQDNKLTLCMPPPTSFKRQIEHIDLTYREVYRYNLVIKLLGNPKTYGGEEYLHFLQTINTIELFDNLWYHPFLQSSMEKFHFPLEAQIWLKHQRLCPEWKTKWRNSFEKDRPYYKYTMEHLKKEIGAYSEGFLRVVLDMELKKRNKMEKGRATMNPKQYKEYESKKNRVDVITIFNIVTNIADNICDHQLGITELQVIIGIQTLFPGFLLDLYDFLVQTVKANLEFLQGPSTVIIKVLTSSKTATPN